MNNLPDITKTMSEIAKQLDVLPSVVKSMQIQVQPIISAQKAMLESVQPLIQAQKNAAAIAAALPKFEDLFGVQTIFRDIAQATPEEKRAVGSTINEGKQKYLDIVELYKNYSDESLTPIDVTAPFDVNTPVDKRPKLLPAVNGSRHPLMTERDHILDIFYRMGFNASESRELDDDYHMFGALNFPEGHPARDDYDTFMTEQRDADGKRLIAPAHTSTMQNRLLKKYKPNLENGEPIAVIVPDRVFRNEDLDARHEHTFYQIEGIYVDKGVHAGHLVATIKAWLSGYYGKEMAVKIQPFYFPFTEPSFEFAAECIFCDGKGCTVCSQTGWIELGGCGMIHPNVLRAGDVDPEIYTGFAWGFGIDRLVMLKYGIEDVRHFQSGRLDFLRQFA
jgi:phenylalanyl-tRNA synthetase alpha chain